MQKFDWDKIEDAADYPRAVPGGYVAVITGVQDREDKEYLFLEWDFVEGPLAGSHRDCFARQGFWPMGFMRSYKEKALPFFKAFKTALEESNPGYRFDEANLNAMVGRRVGVVLGEEEYLTRNGEVKQSLKVQQTRSVDAIRRGNFEVPALKKLKDAPPPANTGGYGGVYPVYDDGPLPWE